ncbi:putative gtpase activating protein [Phaeomoniella chlamydospora]|uniref:Putative gtpase activating protein n=1 Tax=Phaeomoniella chlamydospora TaxID=158046 RepID=A0A0G2GZM1_PHACM|nr:putative gtpase activating protein [Phaeomoniella chlamydospora]
MLSSLSEQEIAQAWGSANFLLSTAPTFRVRVAAYDLYIAFCVQYQHNAVVVTQWLHKFGNPEDPQDHDRLQIKEGRIVQGSHRIASLIHLLATLLATWHKKAEAARKQADQYRRSSKRSREASSENSILLREEQELQGLFDFTKFYVALQKQNLPIDDSSILSQSLITICKAATTPKHLENGLDILSVMHDKAEFTEQALREIIEVLCSIIVQVRNLAKRSYDVLGLFMQGSYRKRAGRKLLECIANAKEAGPSKRMETNVAQGAVMVLQRTLPNIIIEQIQPFDLGDVLSTLASVVGKGHDRLDVQILLLLSIILKAYGVSRLGMNLWGNILMILQTATTSPSELDQSDVILKIVNQLINREKVEAPAKGDSSYPYFVLADKLSALVKVYRAVEADFYNLSDQQEYQFLEYFIHVDPRLSAYSSKTLVRLFLRTVNKAADQAASVYEKILQIAESDIHLPEHRLDCLRLLFRLRCDSSNRVWILAETESEHIATALYRTKATSIKANSSNNEPLFLTSHDLTTGATAEADTVSLWMYPGPRGLPENPPDEPSCCVFANKHPEFDVCPDHLRVLDMKRWLEAAMSIITSKTNWEVYSYVVVHLGAQLANMQLFHQAEAGIRFLRNKVVEIIVHNSYMDPPQGLKKANVATCVYNILTMLIPYHAFFTKDEEDQMVNCFVRGLATRQGATKSCIHALLICSLEIPMAFDRYLGQVLDEMSRIITQPLLSMHVLEFLSGFGRSTELRKNITNDEIRSIFGICINYLNIARENKAKGPENQNRLSSPAARQSSLTKVDDTSGDYTNAAKEFPDYVFALAFHVMNFWFLSMKLEDRAGHVGWLVRRLVYRDGQRQYIEEQSQVFIDMMQRVTFSDLGETLFDAEFASEADGTVVSKSWLVGHSIVTVQTAVKSGKTQLIKRQASGTTHATYQQHTAPIPAHFSSVQVEALPESSQTAMLPSHVMLQLVFTAAGIGSSVQPILLQDNPSTERALRAFDNNPTVDSHGVGLIYIGPGQKLEADILANTSSSPDFEQLLENIGTKISIRNAGFNIHGLSADIDGEFTYAWRDRLTEMVFHIPSMMPTNIEDDPQHNNKKRTIGNDFVKIIFNRSNLPFNFDTFPTQFNHVNILITPANFATISDNRNPFGDPSAHDDLENTFYKVQCLTNNNIPNITAAAEAKVVSGRNLAVFVRQITLNALLFALVWQHGDQSSRYTSRWRNRLQEIKRLRERVVRDMNKKADEAAAEEAAPPSTPGLFGGRIIRKTAGERTSLYPEDRDLAAVRPVSDFDSALAGGNMVDILDFSKWSN